MVRRSSIVVAFFSKMPEIDESRATHSINQPMSQRIDLTEINQKIKKFIEERDWAQFHSPKNISMSIAIEAAELMEHFQWANSDEESRKVMDDAKKRADIEDEIADIAIYLLDFCQLYGIDLEKTIAAKLQKNIEKYPVQLAHGKSEKYTNYRKDTAVPNL